LPSNYLLSNSNSNNEEFCVEGVIVLDDLETCVNIKGSSVIVFDDSAKSNQAIDELEKGGDVQIAFESALEGNAEEISIERLVRFYLNNS
jgi:hypothetical protein